MNDLSFFSPADFETRRLGALAEYRILDTENEAVFDEIVEAVSLICDTPIAMISFIDSNRQWLKSVKGLDVQEVPRDISICAHAIMQTELFVVPDTMADARFANNPLVTSPPHLRFYAGALLKNKDGYPIGTLCALDYKPRKLTKRQRITLQVFANQVMAHLELMLSHRIQAKLIRELQDTREKLETLSSTDPLTGLLNRRAFEQHFKNEVCIIQRGTPSAALMLIDLDHFKAINDTHGHQVGDRVIVRFVALCREVFRHDDVISRWGGDEFMVMLPTTSSSEAAIIAERLHQHLANTPMLADSHPPLYCTVSIGVSNVTSTSTMDECLLNTDRLLYKVKHGGRNGTATKTG